MIDGEYTADGLCIFPMRITPVRVQRSLVLRFLTPEAVDTYAKDLDLLGCHVVVDGLTIRVSGSHDVLAGIEKDLT